MFQTVKKENVTNCEINDINYTFPDISSVSYYSNGNTLNSTIWLSSPQVVPTNENVSFMYIVFTIHFDVHSTFDERLDYVAGILWNNTSQEWGKEVAENSFDGKTRLLTATANYSGSDGLNPSGYAVLSTDLETIHFPSQYNVLFTVDNVYLINDVLCHVSDTTNWIPIPTPEYVMTLSSAYINLRPGEERNVEINIASNSLSTLDAAALIFSRNVSGVNVQINPEVIYVPPYGFGTSDLHLHAIDTATPKSFTLPLSANISFLTSVENTETGVRGPKSQTLQQISKSSNLTITVLQPLTLSEHFRNFLNEWINPLTGAITAISATATGILGWLLGIRRYRIKTKSNPS